jgi:TfoX/Sxy family transcriptional regulator of competence genes
MTSGTSAPGRGALGEETVMAFDERLAERVRAELDHLPDVTEKRMFGGLAFLLSGRMACGVAGESLMVRLDPAALDAALAEAGARPFVMKGRPMKGWLLVEPDGTRDDAALRSWVGRSVAFAAALPPRR